MDLILNIFPSLNKGFKYTSINVIPKIKILNRLFRNTHQTRNGTQITQIKCLISFLLMVFRYITAQDSCYPLKSDEE